MVDTTKYKSVAIKIPYYDALVRMGLSMHRGPGQEMMHIIKKAADEKGIRIKNARIIKSSKKKLRKFFALAKRRMMTSGKSLTN